MRPPVLLLVAQTAMAHDDDGATAVLELPVDITLAIVLTIVFFPRVTVHTLHENR